jgi:Arc/MetJ-type ribon-helix-helix transcriptional regulator
MPDHTVVIEPVLYREAAELVATAGAFESVDDYVNFVLGELFGGSTAREADAKEERALLRRLEELGYV